MKEQDINNLIAKYIRKIHPEDLGNETSRIELLLYEMIGEVDKQSKSSK